MVRKKKLVFHSDFALSKTGFGRNTKAILSYLFNTGKYEIISIAGGISKAHPELERTPWKSLGVVPVSGQEQVDCNSSPDKARLYAYGAYEVDKVISEEKPDVYITAQDFWGVDFVISKPWFNNITSAIWTTLDSLPLLPSAVKEAPNVKNYWVWSNFAEKEMHKLGHTHVKTIHGCIEVSDFKPLPPEEKTSLREKNNISNDEFIIGFVFRNQLRKSVPNLLQGFKIFKDKNPNVKAKLLLHTHWQEGWNILKLCKESEVDNSDILTTYVCKACRGYEIKNFAGPELNCSYCKTNSASVTTGVSYGVNEKQLNEIYNCMDVYCHPFTSGGQEIPIQEAKLAGLITLVTNYSCGAEMCCPEAYSYALDWSEYREFGTEFIKASTSPQSIAEQLKKVLDMSAEEKNKIGLQIWATTNPELAAKLKPGQTGYQEAYDLLGTQTFGTGQPVSTKVNFEQSTEKAGAPTPELPTGFAQAYTNPVPNFGMGINMQQTAYAPEGQSAPEMVSPDFSNVPLMSPPKELVDLMKNRAFKQAFESRIK